ncbi:MAG: SpoIIE family protein phosphatase [Paracoccaceae bacterium]|nr:SpoIIE family protein phosphatase [Paracoccaceae bacterium]
MSEVFASICLSDRSETQGHGEVRDRLQQAILAANQGLRDQITAGLGQEGMGGTVITTVLQNGALSWISIGDSALYLFRDNQLFRLNEIHSLAPQIDLMVRQGELSEEDGRLHPQRNCLTSALVGADINKIDCPTEPIDLLPGDIVLMASDGLEALETDLTCAILQRYCESPSQQISHALLHAVAHQNAPDQDNVSIIVIKPRFAEADHPDLAAEHTSHPWRISALRRGFAHLRQSAAALLIGRSAL